MPPPVVAVAVAVTVPNPVTDPGERRKGLPELPIDTPLRLMLPPLLIIDEPAFIARLPAPLASESAFRVTCSLLLVELIAALTSMLL